MTTCNPLPPRRSPQALLCLGLAVLAATGCAEPEPERSKYQATVYRTRHGIPHIVASNLGGLGFGQGYALAEDYACTLADQIIKVRGERARYFGPGPGNLHIATDFAFRALDLVGRAASDLSKQPEPVRQLLEGYVAGYNYYLSQPESARLSCAREPWLRPISAEDLSAYHRSVGTLLSSNLLLLAIAAAQPPQGVGAQWQPPPPAPLDLRAVGMGSNGWALGADRTASKRGMLLANPHFPWEGELRLWESHLTIPGQLHAYGATLLGVPGVLIGFNEQVAWTHTVSLAARFTAYRLWLVPGKPTSYFYDGEERQMSMRPITLQVKQADGSLRDLVLPSYSSHHGPIISLPGVGWSPQMAISYRDVNLDNSALLAQYLGMMQAKNMEEFQKVFSTVQGIPWVHTVATDREGNAWYADASAVPNLSADTLRAWGEQLADPSSPQAQLLSLGIVLLEGSRSRDEWLPVAGARSPGLEPFSQVPRLSRRDFVFNSNDNHWLANPEAPLEGFSPLRGSERVPQSPRARMNAVLLTEAREGGASGSDKRFTLEELKAAILNNRSLTAELLRAPVVERCQANPQGSYEGRTVDLREACQLLAAWNGRYDLDSVGATLWRELMGAWGYQALTSVDGPLFSTPFSVAQPIATPSGLRPPPPQGSDPVLDKLAQAVLTLQAADIPLNRPLGQVQTAPVGARRVPVHGGLEEEGVANVSLYLDLDSTLEPRTPRGPVLSPMGLTSEGYIINGGTSFLLAVEYGEGGVRAEAITSYGQSGERSSPYFRDQLSLLSQKQWRPVLFSLQDVYRDDQLTSRQISTD